ncbi:hypothetical protein E2562_030009 [Oryza meyeriana var. granulata]|uniref:Uncharacterized protein n=1 Tax=Oryza meyeriana var. granulata TaxID=110450 RepID=A0A6G1FDQ6_9ORYZ|nr:hypothetical protein E2562_030009 [Oryza meyeriana var. granulata]
MEGKEEFIEIRAEIATIKKNLGVMKGLRAEVAEIKTLLKELCSKRGEGDPEKCPEGEDVSVETSQGLPVVITDGDAGNN